MYTVATPESDYQIEISTRKRLHVGYFKHFPFIVSE